MNRFNELVESVLHESKGDTYAFFFLIYDPHKEREDGIKHVVSDTQEEAEYQMEDKYCRAWNNDDVGGVECIWQWSFLVRQKINYKSELHQEQSIRRGRKKAEEARDELYAMVD